MKKENKEQDAMIMALQCGWASYHRVGRTCSFCSIGMDGASFLGMVKEGGIVCIKSGCRIPLLYELQLGNLNLKLKKLRTNSYSTRRYR